MRKFHKGLLVILFVVPGLAFGLFVAWAQVPDQVVFMSDQDGNREIYVMNADGSNVQRLTTNSWEDKEPAWSPDRRQIAFVSFQDGTAGIYTMSSNGGNQQRLTPNDSSYYDSPAWSPDGRQIAFISDRGGGLDIYVIDLGGSEPRRLTAGDRNVENIDPAWSPDGSRIAFSSNKDQYFDIYVIDIDGSNERRLTIQENAEHYSPVWSPNGLEIAYTANSNGLAEIFIMNADGTDKRLVSSAESSFAGGITWSPDSQSLMYVVWGSGENRTIRSVRVDGSNVSQITDSQSNADYPNWDSPEPIAPVGSAGSAATPSNPCTNSRLAPQMIVGAQGWVLPQPPVANRLRNGPGTNYQIIGEIQPGEVFEVTAGPECANNANWWQVELRNGQTGWTMEGDTYYFIEPY